MCYIIRADVYSQLVYVPIVQTCALPILCVLFLILPYASMVITLFFFLTLKKNKKGRFYSNSMCKSTTTVVVLIWPRDQINAAAYNVFEFVFSFDMWIKVGLMSTQLKIQTIQNSFGIFFTQYLANPTSN